MSNTARHSIYSSILTTKQNSSHEQDMHSIERYTTNRMRNPSGSTSSSMSSSSSSANLTLNERELKQNNLNEPVYHDVLIIFPNGFKTVKKIESKKAIYDLLIELSATAKLIPTNYTLKLYTNDDEANDDDMDKLIEYTPNQTIGQLNPAKIRLIPKTSTLKHQQLQLLSPIGLNHSDSSNITSTHIKKALANNTNLNNNRLSTKSTSSHIFSSSSLSTTKTETSKTLKVGSELKSHSNSSSIKSVTLKNPLHSFQTQYQQPFELTIRIEVNLPFNQKTIVRVRPDIKLEDLFHTICKEANLDKNRYDLLVLNNRICSAAFEDSLSAYDTKEVTLALKSFTKHTENSSQKTFARFRNDIKNKSRSVIDLSVQSNDYAELNEKKLTNNSTADSMLNLFSKRISSNSKKSATLKKCENHSQSKIERLNEPLQSVDVSQFTRTKKKMAPAPPPPPISSLSKPDEVSANNVLATTASKNLNQESSNNMKTATSTTTIDKLDLNERELAEIMNLTRKKKKAAPPPPPPSQVAPSQSVVLSKTQQQPEASDQFNKNSQKRETELDESPTKILSNSSSPTSSSSSSSSASASSSSASSLKQNDQEKATKSPINRSEPKRNHVQVEPRSDANKSNLVIQTQIVRQSVEEINLECISPLNVNDEINDSKICYVNDDCVGSFKNTSSCEFAPRKGYFAVNDTHSSPMLTPNHSKANINLSRNSSINAYDQMAYGQHNGLIIKQTISTNEQTQTPYTTESRFKQAYNESFPTPPNDSKCQSLTDSYEVNHNDSIEFQRSEHNNQADSSLNSEMNVPSNNTESDDKHSDEPVMINYERRTDECLQIQTSPVRKEATIEVRPAYTNTTIVVNEQVDDNWSNNGIESFIDKANDKISKNVIYSHNLNSSLNNSPTGSNSPQALHIKTNEFNSNHNNYQKESKECEDVFFKPCLSSPPQFPAIGEDEINELHPNYTVVRSGDIIEKNGTYYSSDGTIRGYSGTVKTLANSKTLNEVFLKQQELQRIHEREYELEMQRKQIEAQEKNERMQMEQQTNRIEKHNSCLTSPREQQQALRNNKPRNSLGNIIANEKRASSTTSLNSFKTLSSNSNIFNKSKGTMKMPEADTIDNELSKKLEGRRQIIANHLAANSMNTNSTITTVTSNLQIDTSTKYDITSTHSIPSSCSSSGSMNDHSSINSSVASPESPHSNNTEHEGYHPDIKKSALNVSLQSSASSTTSSSSDNAHSYNFILKNKLNNNNKVQSELKQSPSSSFVMSAKYKVNSITITNTQASNSSTNANFKPFNKITMVNSDNAQNNQNSLLDELKSAIAMVEKEHAQQNCEKENTTAQKFASTQQATLSTPSFTTFGKSVLSSPTERPPAVAPKNFTNDIKHTLNQKNNVYSMRENLMESIKGFSISNLRKVNDD